MEQPCIRGLGEWRPLARGRLAVLWQARQFALDRLVAVKVYRRTLEEGRAHRFLGEAAALGRVSDHPGIVSAYDAGILADDRPYLVLELCPGGSLARWLEPGQRPPAEQVRQVGLRMADALAAVHAGGVLHRDVGPANILIDSYGGPRLADFGLAVVAGVEPEAIPEPGVATPAYAPLEVLRMQPAAEPADVFSLAATLYALLAGQPPRPTVDLPPTPEQLDRLAGTPIAPLPEVDQALMEVLWPALSDDPQRRPTAAGFRDQLAEVAATPGAARRPHAPAGAAASAPTATPAQPVPDQPSRSRSKGRVAALALAAALVAVLVPLTAWWGRQPAQSGTTGVVVSTTSAGLPSPGTPTAAAPAPSASSAAGPGTGAGTGAKANAIELKGPVGPVKPFETARIDGRYQGRPGMSLRLQRWEGGRWVAFPLPTRTDASGRFTAYAELGQPGRHRLRLLDPASGVTSEPFVLAIRS